MTLIELLTDTEIKIPIIQRDYAQGRKNTKANSVRKNLINDIKICLSDKNKTIDFNFVYGTSIDEGGKKIFFPIDGQQRLTSLYLLHWFLDCNYKGKSGFEELKSFSYMTRSSSTEFFNILKEDKNIKKYAKKENLRKNLINDVAFKGDWINDPTVDAALNFLDDLSNDKDAKEFKEKANIYYDRLKGDAITFTHMTEGSGSDPEIRAAKSYLRMNARGKVLDPFENLKAMFDKIDDAIESKDALEPKIDFSTSYDTDYINKLYEKNTGNGNNLEVITEKINNDSLNCMKKIYNIFSQLKKGVFENLTEDEFIAEIYAYSQKKLEDTEKKLLEEYLNMVMRFFAFYDRKKYDQNLRDVLEKMFSVDVKNERDAIAVLFYIYCCGEKKIEMTPEKVDKLLYVLKNLQYEKWNNYIQNIFIFAEEAAKSTDVFEYFANEYTKPQFKDISLDDIDVRLKEQKIKSEIIAAHPILSYKFFDALESKDATRKIQYLLYIAGYWDNEKPNYGELLRYMKIAETYFMDNEKLLEYRKYFAIATYLDLLEKPEDINTKDSDNEHIWSNDYYFWNIDTSIKKDKLDTLKKFYDKMDSIKDYETKFKNLTETKYDTCWLKYAVMFDIPEVFTEPLRIENGIMKIVTTKYGEIRLDRFMLMKELELTMELNDLTKKREKSWEFSNGHEYWLEGERILVASDNDRKFQLQYDVKIIGVNDNKEKLDCLYSYDDSIYTIYEVTSNQYKFNKYIYDLAKEKTEFDNRVKEWKDYFTKNYKDQNSFLEVWRDKKEDNATWKPIRNRIRTFVPNEKVSDSERPNLDDIKFNGSSADSIIELKNI